jgi:hypothetical protein
MLPCNVNCDKGICVWGGGGRTVELLVYIIHVSIPWKCCHKLSLKLECLVDSVSGEQLKEKGDSCAFACRKACGRKKGRLRPFLTSVLTEVAASPGAS